jgi:probable phosphoglycerate mutase
MLIHLIRHGETTANAERVFQKPDNPLNEQGRAQAERLGERLQDQGIVQIWSSDYARASETAGIVARWCGAPVHFDAELRERNFGDLRGRAYSDVGAEIFAPDYEPPNGETWAQFSARVARAWHRVAAEARKASGNLAVVTHGLVCRALLQQHLTLQTPLAPPAQGFRNCSLTLVEAKPPFPVRLIDCCEHLPGIRRPRPSISGI